MPAETKSVCRWCDKAAQSAPFNAKANRVGASPQVRQNPARQLTGCPQHVDGHTTPDDERLLLTRHEQIKVAQPRSPR